MTTTAYELDSADGWVEVAADTVETLIIDNQSIASVQITFADSAPGADAPYHQLPSRAVVPRMAAGSIYVRNQASIPCRVVVS